MQIYHIRFKLEWYNWIGLYSFLHTRLNMLLERCNNGHHYNIFCHILQILPDSTNHCSADQHLRKDCISFLIAAIGQAVQLANIIAKFPQICMRADRSSCYYSTYDARSTLDAFQHEWTEGIKLFTLESITGKSLATSCECLRLKWNQSTV